MDDLIELASGNKVNANRGILGIGPDLRISEGYDGWINCMPDEYYDNPDCGDLSPADICELADIAIGRWQRLKALVNPTLQPPAQPPATP